ncbi:MAG: hypothetical protein Q7J07_09505 [Pelolinea sp.]|nr:hypothetical protein [Pelolinea sp.]
MKKATKIISLFVVILLATAACQQNPALPPESDTPTAEQTSAPAVISADNADQLKAVHSASVDSGAVRATWTADSSTVWIDGGFSVSLYDSTIGEMIAQFNPGEYAVIYDVSPDGKTAAYSDDGMEIRLYDVLAQADTITITPDFPYSSVFFNADGSLLGAASVLDIKIVTWDTSSGVEKSSLRGFETAAPVYSASFGADGKTLMWISRGTVQPMDIASQTMGPILSHEDFVVAQALSPDGNVVATAAAGTIGGKSSPLLTLWNAHSGEILRQIAMPEYYSSIAFSPDSGLIAAGTQDTVILFSNPHGDEVYRFDNGEAISSIAFSPDGTKLITCGDSGTINIYMVGE